MVALEAEQDIGGRQLIEAGKELEAQNKALSAELATLKASNDNMEATLASIQDDIKGLKARTGYGIGKASMGGWPLALILITMGGSSVAFLIGAILRNRKQKAG